MDVRVLKQISILERKVTILLGQEENNSNSKFNCEFLAFKNSNNHQSDLNFKDHFEIQIHLLNN